MSVLLSIKPEFTDQILDGSKLYEFRKRIFKRETEEVWIYSSSPVKKIVGKITLDDVIEDSPEYLWERCKQYAGISEDKFFKYFEGKETAFALKIKTVEKFSEPIDPYNENPNFTPPQSYAYLENVLKSLA